MFKSTCELPATFLKCALYYCTTFSKAIKGIQSQKNSKSLSFQPHLFCTYAPQSKNAVSTNIKHIKQSRYIHLMPTSCQPTSILEGYKYICLIQQIPPVVYGSELIVCSSLQEFSTESTLHVNCDLKCRYCVFTLWGRSAHNKPGLSWSSLVAELVLNLTFY